MARADVGGIDGGGFKGRLRVVTINVWSGSRYIGELSFGTWFSFKSYVLVRVRVEASTRRILRARVEFYATQFDFLVTVAENP